MHHRNQETALSTLFKGDGGYCIDTRVEGQGGGGGGGSVWSYQVNGACPLVVMVHVLRHESSFCHCFSHLRTR